MSISLSKFNPRKIEEKRLTGSGPATCVFIGKRGTGKSTLVADILYRLRKINAGVAISATEDGNAFYSNFILFFILRRSRSRLDLTRRCLRCFFVPLEGPCAFYCIFLRRF